AMFELLASIAFAPFLFPGNLRKGATATITTIAAVGVGWLLNTALVKLYGTGSQLLSNFSFVIYGLVRGGKGWSQAGIDFPDLKGDEAQISAVIYQKAFESIVHDPHLLIVGLSKALSESLANLPLHLFGLLADASDGGSPSKSNHILVPALLLLPPLIYGT